MKSKQHEYILKAFLNSSIPAVIRRSSPEFMVIDSVIGGYCSQLIKRVKLISFQSSEIISKTSGITIDSVYGTANTEKQRLKKNKKPDVHVICKREAEIIGNE